MACVKDKRIGIQNMARKTGSRVEKVRGTGYGRVCVGDSKDKERDNQAKENDSFTPLLPGGGTVGSA